MHTQRSWAGGGGFATLTLRRRVKQRHRALAEAKLAAMYKEQLGESLLLDGANKVWEKETVFKESNDHYEWVVILQNREGQIFLVPLPQQCPRPIQRNEFIHR